MTTAISRLNSVGRVLLYALLKDSSLTPEARAAAAKAVALERCHLDPAPGCGSIDASAQFKSASAVVAHLVPAIGDDPMGKIADPGINAFLTATYWDQVVPSNLDVGRVLLDPKDGPGAGVRPRRNPLVAYVTVAATLGDRLPLAAPFLGCRPSAIPRPLGRLCDRGIARSAGAVELVGAMFLTPKGHFRRPKGLRTDGASPMQAMDTLMTLVFGQMGRNYDVDGMSAGQLFELIPNVPILRPWTDGVLGRLTENERRSKRTNP